jgi:chromatin segregation and condensation protein Rec8/ScpA/Scc1 (kleisin family)
MKKINTNFLYMLQELSEVKTKKTPKTKKTVKTKKKSSLAKPVAHKQKREKTYKIVNVTNNEIVEKAYSNGVQIIVENLPDFKECVKFLQGMDAVVFRTTHQYTVGKYSIVYFFPYQGYLIMYAEPQK